MSELVAPRLPRKQPLISVHYKNGSVEVQDPVGCPDGKDPFRCKGPTTCGRAKAAGCFKYKREAVDWSKINGVHLTEYKCSVCGTQIPITNLFVHRQSLLDKLLGHFEPAGFFCPVCGDPWKRCERISPFHVDLPQGLVFERQMGAGHGN